MMRLTLRRGKEESLLRRHPWIFSGAVHHIDGEPDDGELLDVCRNDGTWIARGHYQHGSIAVRILTFVNEPIDADWWQRRLGQALHLRKCAGLIDDPATTCCRLVHGEGDYLPGLVVDLYGSTAVVQCHSTGMYRARAEIVAALRSVLGDRLQAVWDKSSQTVPFADRIGVEEGLLWGESSGEETVLEHGHRFAVNWARGQKTGFFIDQRDNRALLKRYAAGRRILNTFCYTGGFSVCALAGNARHVISVDSSSFAVELAARNVALNFGPNAPHEAIAQDTFSYLREYTGEPFDLIVLDPPAFAKHHRAVANALQGYKRLNARAIEAIAPGGILFTFSCSQAIDRQAFRMTVFSGAAIAGRKVRILHHLSQPVDHPVDIYHPEGEYLKGLVLYVE